MPELPEVEVAARNLARWAKGRRVHAVTCDDVRALCGSQRASLRKLVGLKLADIERVGKNLLLTFAAARGSGPAAKVGVWSHLGMTGKWVMRSAADRAPRFARVRLDFAKGPSLYFVDMRLFGFFRLVKGAVFDAVPALAALPPDPLRAGIDVTRLSRALRRRRTQPLKVALMDQSILPGVGNIQASEALNRAGLDPRRRASAVSEEEVRRLARAVLASFRYTLARFARDGVEGGDRDIEYVEEPGTRNPFRAYGRAGERCRHCRAGVLTRIIQAGRSTYFCPVCQH